jgi:tetratricopeptide (TPR) repeat protein
MKTLSHLILLVFFFTACNNKEEEQPSTSPDIDSQEKIMKDAIDKFPDSLLLKETLIQYYRDNGNYDMAIAATDNAIKKDSANPRLWEIKANIHFEDDDTANAIKAYEKAIQILPDPAYIRTLGSFYAETKNPRALVMADALLNNKAHLEKDAYFLKGLYCNYTHDENKAIGFFDKSLAIDYTYMYAYREKAIALYNLGKYEDALAVLNKAVTLQNNFDEGYYWMGRCQEKLNRTNDAIASYQTALQYDPDFVEARDALAKLGVK